MNEAASEVHLVFPLFTAYSRKDGTNTHEAVEYEGAGGGWRLSRCSEPHGLDGGVGSNFE